MNTMESGPFMVWGKNTKNKARFSKRAGWRGDAMTTNHICIFQLFQPI